MPDLPPRLKAALAPRYELLRHVASGGMGQVYLGHDPALGRDVAVKFLPPEHATAVAMERFVRETRLLAQLDHPGIMPILEARHDASLSWYVMPFFPGGTLADRVGRGPLAPREVKGLGAEILDALRHAHERGIVHRDIKPSNIFLRDGHAVIADFGVAALSADDADTLTEAGTPVGTPRYMAPEQRAGMPGTVASDIYAVGATLIEAATGEAWNPARMPSLAAIPPSLQRTLARAVSQDARDRWPDAAAFREALTDARRPRRRAVAALVAVGLLAAAAWRAASGGTRTPQALIAHGAIVIDPFVGDTGTPPIAAMIAGELDWFPPARVVPWSGTTTAAVDSLAWRITGRLQPSGIDVTILDSVGHVAHAFTVPAHEQAPAMSRAVTDSVVARLMPSRIGDFRLLQGVSRNMAARRAYLAAERAFRASDGDAALRSYDEALRLDPAFTQARWARVIALKWARQPFLADMDALVRTSSGLGEPLGTIVAAQRNPDLRTRMATLDSLAVAHPDNARLLHLRANELFSRGPLVGRDLRDGVAAFTAAAAILPPGERVDALTHLAWASIRIGDRSGADAALRQRRASATSADPYGDLLALVHAGRFQRWKAVPLRTMALAATPPADLARVARFGILFDNPEDQLVMAQSLQRRLRDAAARGSMLAAIAVARLALGRPVAAITALDEAGVAEPEGEFAMQAAEWRVLLPLVGVELPDALVEEGRRRAGALRSRFPLRVAWTLGADAVRAGDTIAASRELELLRQDASAAGRILAATLDALLHGARGDTTGALDLSGAMATELDEDAARATGPLARAVVFVHRAEWQHDVGARLGELAWHQNSDVHGWPAGAPQRGEVDAALGTVMRVRRAELLLQRGDVDVGCREADRASALLRDAERSMMAWRTAAERVRSRCR